MSDVDEKRADVLDAHRDAAGAASHGDLVQYRVLNEKFHAALDAYAAAVRADERGDLSRRIVPHIAALVRLTGRDSDPRDDERVSREAVVEIAMRIKGEVDAARIRSGA